MIIVHDIYSGLPYSTIGDWHVSLIDQAVTDLSAVRTRTPAVSSSRHAGNEPPAPGSDLYKAAEHLAADFVKQLPAAKEIGGASQQRERSQHLSASPPAVSGTSWERSPDEQSLSPKTKAGQSRANMGASLPKRGDQVHMPPRPSPGRGSPRRTRSLCTAGPRPSPGRSTHRLGQPTTGGGG